MGPRLYLALLLLAMAASQAGTFGAFAAALESYGVVPRSVLRTVAIAIVASEALAGTALLVGAVWSHWAGAVLALGVALAWTALAAVALLRRRHVPNCGCFGAHLTQRLRLSVLVQDAGFVGLAAWVVARCPRA